jgi:protein TonB
MSTLGMHYATFQPKDRSSRFKGVAVVIALHALLVYGLVTGLARDALKLVKKPLETAVIQEVVIPPPPPPPPKEIKPPEPQAAVKIDTPPPPAFVPPPDVPAQSAGPAIQSTQQVPTTPPVIAPPAPPPPVDNSKAIAASMENEYAASVRAMLNAAKRYPTGRKASQERPEGKVKIWFTLARNGSLIDAGVLESSNSNMLDDAAMGTVRRATYPGFPPNTWVGQEQHKFQVELSFTPPS